jgi:hypothetical protein
MHGFICLACSQQWADKPKEHLKVCKGKISTTANVREDLIVKEFDIADPKPKEETENGEPKHD